jgi:hypothetical protein
VSKVLHKHPITAHHKTFFVHIQLYSTLIISKFFVHNIASCKLFVQYKGIGKSLGTGVSSFGRSCNSYISKVVLQTMRTFYIEIKIIYFVAHNIFLLRLSNFVKAALSLCKQLSKSLRKI